MNDSRWSVTYCVPTHFSVSNGRHAVTRNDVTWDPRKCLRAAEPRPEDIRRESVRPSRSQLRRAPARLETITENNKEATGGRRYSVKLQSDS